MKKRILVRKEIVGGPTILVGKCPPAAYLNYRLIWSDGTETFERGRSITTMVGFEHLNGTKAEKKQAAKNLYPELYETLQAANLLLNQVYSACIKLDKEYEKE